MKVLLTGAFGNVGVSTLDELLRQGYQVRCFDLPTPANKRTARRYAGRCEVIWGDLRRQEDVRAVVADTDVVLHTAFIIPKLSSTGIESELRPDVARAVNVGGTANLVQALEAVAPAAKLVFTSSLHVYGRTQHLAPPRRVSDVPNPIEHYARHKMECEEMIRASRLTWSIFRLAAALPISLQLDPGMFGVPLANRIEYVHTRDVGLALANAVGSAEIWGKTLHIGGGPRCQYTYDQIVRAIFGAMGLAMPPAEAFTTVPFATDWLDTEESERLLHFQTRTLDDYLVDMRGLLGPRLPFIRLLKAPIRRAVLAGSPQWVRRTEQTRPDSLSGKTALITGASSGIGAAIARALARRDVRVVLVARRADRLELLADEICRDGGMADAIVADLTDEAARERVLSQLMRGGVPDILVNCAGVGWYGYGADMPWPVAQEMLQINVAAVAHLTLAILPHMRRRGSGHIVNISSVAGSLPEQGTAVYSATRAFVDAFTTALHREARGSGVRVSLIRPGAVRSEFSARAAARPFGRPIPAESLAIAPERVATEVVSVLHRPRRVAHAPGVGVLTPWVEPAFGWFIDLLGPALLRRGDARRAKTSAGMS